MSRKPQAENSRARDRQGAAAGFSTGRQDATRGSAEPPNRLELAVEIMRRLGAGAALLNGYVVRVSQPMTREENLHLLAMRLLGRRFAVVPKACGSVDEWLACYGRAAKG